MDGPTTTRVNTSTPIRFIPDPATACRHVDAIRTVLADNAGCGDCLATGDRWVHLRICMTCGHVGCCNDSPNRHATAHHHATSHPIIRSVEPGETWGWCYPDDELLFADHHPPPQPHQEDHP